MVRKALGLLLPAAIGAVVASQYKEISRYLRIRQMSQGSGDGHPQNVPAEGVHAYPSHAGEGALDGTGEFDSPSRGGGPAAADTAQPSDRRP
ncbi:MAG: hypothetical protein WAK82_05805 [Streptosporangiaceae bacterium]